MERLDELSLGVRGQTLGKYKDYLPVASPTTADHMASLLDVLQTSLDAPQQTLVHLGPSVRREQGPTLSESVSGDLLPGAPLCTTLPTAALR